MEFLLVLDECKGRAALKVAEEVFKQPNKKGLSKIKEAVVKVVKVRHCYFVRVRTSLLLNC